MKHIRFKTLWDCGRCGGFGVVEHGNVTLKDIAVLLAEAHSELDPKCHEDAHDFKIKTLPVGTSRHSLVYKTR